MAEFIHSKLYVFDIIHSIAFSTLFSLDPISITCGFAFVAGLTLGISMTPIPFSYDEIGLSSIS